jgi:hypothetical protein
MNKVFDIRSDTAGCARVNYGVGCFLVHVFVAMRIAIIISS